MRTSGTATTATTVTRSVACSTRTQLHVCEAVGQAGGEGDDEVRLTLMRHDWLPCVVNVCVAELGGPKVLRPVTPGLELQTKQLMSGDTLRRRWARGVSRERTWPRRVAPGCTQRHVKAMQGAKAARASRVVGRLQLASSGVMSVCPPAPPCWQDELSVASSLATIVRDRAAVFAVWLGERVLWA